MSRSLLLDTSALLWLINGESMDEDARGSIRAAAAASELFVSPFSAWEIGTLMRKRRIALNRDAEDWFESALNVPGFRLAEMTWKTLYRSTSLPGNPPKDPADRILISTARRNSLCLVTRDREILGYSRAGHVDAMRC
jgi:PIN domain nuclease of toxin-antitoxin system